MSDLPARAEVAPIMPDLSLIAEGIDYVREAAAKAGRILLVTAVLATGGAITSNKIDAQNRRAEQLAQGQEQTAEQLASAQAQLNRMSNIIGDLGIGDTNLSPGVLSGKSLSSVESLPGYGQSVSPELTKKIKDATVQLGIQDKNATGDAKSTWGQNCTATKVVYNGRTFVFTAAHCFADGIPALPQKGGADTVPDAINITNMTDRSYAVLDPSISSKDRPSAPPLALVKNIAIDRTELDWALLEVTPNPQADRQFDDIPALNLDELVPVSSEPGQQATLYAVPNASGNTPITGQGTYLGRYGAFDLVGINPTNASADACDYGASGSQARLADGHTTGPLHGRDSIGYPDGSRERNDGTAANMRKIRLGLEDALGLNLDNFATVCYFSAGAPDTLPNLTAVLQNPNLVLYPPSMK